MENGPTNLFTWWFILTKLETFLTIIKRFWRHYRNDRRYAGSLLYTILENHAYDLYLAMATTKIGGSIRRFIFDTGALALKALKVVPSVVPTKAPACTAIYALCHYLSVKVRERSV